MNEETKGYNTKLYPIMKSIMLNRAKYLAEKRSLDSKSLAVNALKGKLSMELIAKSFGETSQECKVRKLSRRQ